jgi:peptidoglycan/LPS O-acetylase OafA/YrhL
MASSQNGLNSLHQLSRIIYSMRLGYIPTLDGMRGVCVLAVMVHHLNLPGTYMGSLGVDAFFVLSGFLITALLVQEHTDTGRINLKQFYLRRALRLLPALYGLIIAACLLIMTLGEPFERDTVFQGALSSIIYINNWALIDQLQVLPGLGFGPLNHLWSLGVEDQFYLLWAPAAVFLLYRFKPRTMLVVIAVAAIVSAIVCALVWRTTGIYERSYMGTDARGVGLLLGCALGVIYTKYGLSWFVRFRRIVIIIIASIVFVVTVAVTNPVPSTIMYDGGFVIVAIGVALLITLLLLPETSPLLHRIFTWRPLVWVGTISYGLYLWHGMLFWFISPYRISANPYVLDTLAILVSFLAAFASRRYVEQPFLRLKGKRYQVAPSPVKHLSISNL